LLLSNRASEGATVTIETAGKWWVGSDPADVADYLAAYTRSAEAYPTDAYRAIKCPCGSRRFRVTRAGSVTRRVCPACGRSKFICRAAGDWEEAVAERRGERYQCVECRSTLANVTVGFAGYEENPELDAVKWFYVGLRCARCGVLCCFNDGKVGRGSAAHVYRRA
jgi:hypothetical protein